MEDHLIKDKEDAIEECKNLSSILVDDDTFLDIMNIGYGVFDPLDGFMTSTEYHNVVENMKIRNGVPWTIPISLDIPENKVHEILDEETTCLKTENNEPIAILDIKDIFKINFDNDIKKIFGINDLNHPGVLKERERSIFRVGGKLEVFPNKSYEDYLCYPPHKTKEIFKKKGWKTIAGFQTRNPIHRAHEYLQRTALELVDGLFIHPLIGWKKSDDFSPMSIIKTYEKMINEFYPKEVVFLSTLRTAMRYAGPREAVFHAIIRKNYGCTHFIVGRDHAGVGGYYGKYEAHELISKIGDLGINVIKLHGPFFCKKCNQVVTDKTCPHGEKYALHVSGTEIRSMIAEGKPPPSEYMRKEIAKILIDLHKSGKAFCGDAQ